MKNPAYISSIFCPKAAALPALLVLMSLSGHALAASCTASYTYTANGGSATYNLGSGQSLKINSGTFTGYIDALPSGASVCVETGATFAPGGFNNISGSIINHGTSNLQNFTYNSGVVVDNYGTLTLNGLNTNGTVSFLNRTAATMNIPYSFQLGLNSTMTNDGLLVAGQDFNTENGTTLTNNYRLEVEGNFNPDGKFDNYGRVYAKKFMNINANSNVSNHCTLVSYDGFNNNSPLMNNQGTILITSATGAPGGPWQNNKAFQNGSNAKIAGGDFINNSTFTGGGLMVFSGDTRNQGAFNGNSAADKITFYDETQTASQIFDIEWVTPTNTVRAVTARPTELDAPNTCTGSYKSFALSGTGADDYGDAPASYGDASHAIVASIQLGQNAPDAEAASQYSFNATGDGTDEDGAPHYPAGTGPAEAALFPVLKMTNTSYTLPVTATNTTGAAGKLYGWIDFNKNGTFETKEAASVAVANGSSNATVNLVWSSIPGDIKLGTTFIRLRLTTDATVTTGTPTGSASNGEVEDYPIAIYQAIAPDSPSLSVISGADASSCRSTVFTDDFNDLGAINWGANVTIRQDIRNWIASGGGPDTYADTHITNATQQMSVYMGNGSVRGISPSFTSGFTFDANGHLTSAIDAIALRDVPDDLNLAAKAAHWGPEPVKLSRTFPSQAGKKYRLYFKAIPEDGSFAPGIMRVDAPGGSIHFKAPGANEGTQNYAIEFTASAATSTVAFVNYGHVSGDWCDPQSNDWCTTGGTTDGTTLNELIIDDVVVATVEDCEPPFPTNICGKTIDNPLELDFSGTATLISGTAKQPGSVYRFSNVATGVDARVTMNALQADTLPRWLDGDLGGQLQGAQADKFFDMTVNLVNSGTSTAISPVDLVLTSFDLDGSAGEPYSDGVEYFSPSATFTGAGSQLQASDMGSSIRYTLPLSARGVDDLTAANPAYAAGAVHTNVSSFRTKGLVVDDNGSSTRSIFVYADGASFKKFGGLECDTQVTVSSVSGVIFEDVDYGGGAGRAYGTAGTKGISGARVELYDASGNYLNSVTTTIGGSYSLTTLPDGNYYVRVVNDSVSSSRTGANGSELAVQTYRSSGASAITNEIGGRNPAAADAPANTSKQKISTTTFKFPDNAQAQSVQAVSVNGGNISGVSFGFNFATIVNANDSGQGSLRQFLLNANLLGSDNLLAQAGRTAGKENAILMLPTSDPNYNSAGIFWSIATLSALPDISAPLIFDSSTQSGFAGTPALELNGNNAGAGINGLTLAAGSNGSKISNLAINRFKGAGIYINASTGHIIQSNRIGTSPSGTTAHGNSGPGIRLNATSNNLIGDPSGAAGNLIANNGSDGINITGATSSSNTILGNSIHSNTGIGIDLNDDSVTNNDEEDIDVGPNSLLNFPDVTPASFGANGSRIITYDFNLDLPANTNGYRLDFYKSDSKDSSGFGEGQTWVGSKDFTHPGGGTLNYKGSFNANQSVSSTEYISTTVTEKSSPLTYANTSEFSGATNNNSVVVCTDLLSNPSTALPDQVLDENAKVITYLKAIDSKGNPVTYVISGGADASMFTVGAVTDGSTDCAKIEFVKSVIVKAAPTDTRAILPGMVDPGNYEIPMDNNKDNIYELEITATDSSGKKYIRTLSTRVMDVNEAPIIISAAAASVAEDGSRQALDINSQDQDTNDTEGNGLSYAISGGADQAQFVLDSATGVLSFGTVPDYDAPADSNRDNTYEVEVTVTDRGGLSTSKTFSITVTNSTVDDGVKLTARALLQGAYDNTTGLMGNELAMLNLLPTQQPYAAAPFNHKGTESLGAPAMSGSGNDAVVDWMLVDLRNSQSSIVSSRAVLIQRDGDLVDALSGSPILHFANVAAGNYYVSVRHRNHLGAITASPISLGSSAKLVDFSQGTTAVQGSGTRYISGSLALLWAGDINGSNTLTSSGPGNDITNLLSSVITSSANPQAYTNFNLKGYLATDLNMDGSTLFSGPNNDANMLIGNVIMHPLNSNFAANYIVRGGL